MANLLHFFKTRLHDPYARQIWANSGQKSDGGGSFTYDETRIINCREAVLRESPDLVILLAYSILEINYLLGVSLNPVMTTIFIFLGSDNTIWFLLEIITTLTNDKRRALHDFIAKSVVVRKDLMYLDTLPEELEVTQRA